MSKLSEWTTNCSKNWSVGVKFIKRSPWVRALVYLVTLRGGPTLQNCITPKGWLSLKLPRTARNKIIPLIYLKSNTVLSGSTFYFISNFCLETKTNKISKGCKIMVGGNQESIFSQDNNSLKCFSRETPSYFRLNPESNVSFYCKLRQIGLPFEIIHS